MSNLKQTEPVSGPKSVLSIRDLCLARGGRTLFDKLNLEVNRGEVIAIVGASGSGKSSLLELIFSDPRHPPLYSGVIHFDRAQAALVMQDGALLDHLSVLDNLQLVSAYSGSNRTNTELLELLERLNISSSQAGQLAGHLSGGEKRRVAVARALVYQPELIFFDEPDAGLDIANRRELAALLRELVEIHRTTVVIVTHDSLLAGLVAHKVHVLEEGRLQQAFAWDGFPATPAAATQRREAVETLAENARLPQIAAGSTGLDKATSLPRQLARDVWRTVASVLRPNPSPRHYLAVFWKMLQMGAFSGIPFFFLVGAMLGATTIVVVRNLVVSVVQGLDVPEMVRHTVEYFLSAYPSLREWLIAQIMDRVDFNVLAEPTLKRLVEEPDMVLDHLNGLYIAVFVPAIAAILFAARSGSVVSAWLGVLTFGRKVEALKSLGVN
ncbi:MAG: ATP-binding cassette domain-containing protein, partial [Pseudomonadota bacterium]